MTLEQIVEDMIFSKKPLWFLRIKGAKKDSYTFGENNMDESTAYFRKCYERLPDGDYELILKGHINQSRGEIYRTFTKGMGTSNTPSVIGGVSAGIGSTQWGIESVIAGMEKRFSLELKNDRLERENKELRKKVEDLENNPAVSGTQEIINTLDPYIKHFLNYHYPVQGAAVGTLKGNKGDEVPAENEELTEEQLNRLWVICERFAAVFETDNFDDLLTQFEKLAAKAETMPAVVKSML